MLVADVLVLAAAAAHPQLEHNWVWDFPELMVGPQTGVLVGNAAACTVVIVLPVLANLYSMQGFCSLCKVSVMMIDS